MSGQWQDSKRIADLPSSWKILRKKVLRRDGYTCQRCGVTKQQGVQLEVDHIKRGDDHSLYNLQTLCVDCHKIKTQAEVRASKKKRKVTTVHPGLK